MGRLKIFRPTTAGEPGPAGRLNSWKEIAVYLDRGVRTVQRWEKEEGLPVRRLRHGKQGSVYALQQELDAWWESRGDELASEERVPTAHTPSWRKPSFRRVAWALAATVTVTGLVGWRFLSKSKTAEAMPRVVQLTTYPGEEWHPVFSPDGMKLTFCYKPEGRHDFDLYLKEIGVDTPVPLVKGPASEGSAVWSPDGKSIVFARVSEPGRYTVLRVPSIGGSEEKLTECYGPQHGCSMTAMLCPWITWSPDGDWLVMVDGTAAQEPLALFAFSLRTFQKHRLTFPPSDILGDAGPSFSPDGRTLAFHRMFAGGLSEVFLLDLSEDLRAQGEPRQLTFEKGLATSPEWTPDGREIIYSLGSSRRYHPRLHRIAVSGEYRPLPLPYVPAGAWFPRVSHDGANLAFVQHSWVANIYRLDLSAPGVPVGQPSAVLRSTAVDLQPSYSPNGDRIAFSSDRSGSGEIWVAEADGSNPVRLTSSPATHNSRPRWSPNGDQIAFISDLNGSRDVHVVDSRGGRSLRLTSDPADDNSPAWSRDGQWIYFTSLRSGSPQVWKMPASGGEAIQITRGGAARPQASLDGEFLYYTKRAIVPTAIWKVPVDGGQEVPVLGPAHAVDQYTVTASGIYFIPVVEPSGPLRLMFHDFTTGRIKPVIDLEEVSPACSRCMDWNESGLAVSPDGGSILYGKVDVFGADLMLVKSFR